MVERIILLPQAVHDIAEAFEWYEGRKAGLGLEFVECIEESLDSLCTHPERHVAVFKNYRRAKIRRFPYLLFYEYADKTVSVYSVFHGSRDPRRWRNRLP